VPLERGRSLLLVGLFFLAACRQEASPEAASGVAASPPRPFVAFSQPSIVIDRVGATVAVPAAVGSTLSPLTLSSEDPSVVEITPTGGLHALKPGRTLVRAAGNPENVLQVEIAELTELVFVPAAMTLQPRGRGQLALFDKARGRVLDPSQAQWFTTAPDVATAIEGNIQSGDAIGVTTITATYAGQVIRARVEVVRAASGTVAIRPAKPPLQVGQAVTFEALQAGLAVPASWSTTQLLPVLHQSGPTTFVGQQPGKAQVCANAVSQRTCTEVTVTR
jgi:hypothetical protein